MSIYKVHYKVIIPYEITVIADSEEGAKETAFDFVDKHHKEYDSLEFGIVRKIEEVSNA